MNKFIDLKILITGAILIIFWAVVFRVALNPLIKSSLLIARELRCIPDPNEALNEIAKSFLDANISLGDIEHALDK